MPATLQAYRAHLFGQNTEQGQGVDTHSAVWVTHDSPTTEIIDPTHDNNPVRRSLIIWDTGHHYAATRRSFVLWQVRPLSNTPQLGRILNFHNSPNLPGGWDWGGGVSPVALDFTPSAQVDDKDRTKVYEGVTLTIEPTGDSIEGLGQRYHWTVVSLAEWAAAAAAGQWISIVLDITWGSIHGSVTGAVKAYTFGNDTPVVNASGINTIYWNDYRAESSNDPFGPNPGGGQRGVSAWAGAYVATSSGLSSSEVGSYDFTLFRVGATVQEALNDGTAWPIGTLGPGQATHSYSGGGSTNLEQLPPVDPASFALPAALGGTGGGGGGGGGGSTPDPTPPTVAHYFGKRAVGNTQSTGMSVDARRGNAIQASESIAATDAWALITGAGTAAQTGQLRAVVYDMTGPPDAGGAPTTKLAESAGQSFAGDLTRQWVQFPLLSSFVAAQGGYYLLEFQAGGVQCLGIEYDATGGGFYFKTDAYADGADVNHGTPNSIDVRLLSIFLAGTLVVVTNPTSPRLVGTLRSTATLRTVPGDPAAQRPLGGVGGGI